VLAGSIKVATCGWGAPFEEFCADAAHAGYEGIESGIDQYAGREPELRALLDRYGLTVAAMSSGGLFLDPATREREIDAVEETARRISAFGVHTLEMHTGARPVGGPSDEQIRRYADGLNEVGRRCKRHGVNMGIHNHCIQFIETEREIDVLYRHLDPGLVGIGFDTGHLALADCDPAAMFRRYIDRGYEVTYAHLKDLYQVSKPAGEGEQPMAFDEVLDLVVASDILTWLVIQDVAGRRIVLGGGKIGHDFFRAHRRLIQGVRRCDITEYQFAEIGQGFVDFKAVFDVLRAAEFDGWVAVELDVSYRSRLESAMISRDNIRQTLGA
jgi:sugar phosphate isomerase/epimerase